MCIFIEELHHLNKYLEIMPLRVNSQRVLLEERNDDIVQIAPAIYLEPITVLMIGARIFLKVYASASEKTLQCKENSVITLNKLEIEFWLYHYPSHNHALCIDISDIDRETSFTVY